MQKFWEPIIYKYIDCWWLCNVKMMYHNYITWLKNCLQFSRHSHPIVFQVLKMSLVLHSPEMKNIKCLFLIFKYITVYKLQFYKFLLQVWLHLPREHKGRKLPLMSKYNFCKKMFLPTRIVSDSQYQQHFYIWNPFLWAYYKHFKANCSWFVIVQVHVSQEFTVLTG